MVVKNYVSFVVTTKLRDKVVFRVVSMLKDILIQVSSFFIIIIQYIYLISELYFYTHGISFQNGFIMICVLLSLL